MINSIRGSKLYLDAALTDSPSQAPSDADRTDDSDGIPPSPAPSPSPAPEEGIILWTTPSPTDGNFDICNECPPYGYYEYAEEPSPTPSPVSGPAPSPAPSPVSGLAPSPAPSPVSGPAPTPESNDESFDLHELICELSINEHKLYPKSDNRPFDVYRSELREYSCEFHAHKAKSNPAFDLEFDPTLNWTLIACKEKLRPEFYTFEIGRRPELHIEKGFNSQPRPSACFLALFAFLGQAAAPAPLGMPFPRLG